MTGVELIAAERERQIGLGWQPSHDDEHTDMELSRAAGAYVFAAVLVNSGLNPNRPPEWPWEPKWWKPSDDPIRNLTKAGALIAAEIDRIQRGEGSND